METNKILNGKFNQYAWIDALTTFSDEYKNKYPWMWNDEEETETEEETENVNS